MRNKERNLKHSYERKDVSYEWIYKKSPILGGSQHPIGKVGSTTSFNSEDDFPSVSLSVRNLNHLLTVVIVKAMKIC